MRSMQDESFDLVVADPWYNFVNKESTHQKPGADHNYTITGKKKGRNITDPRLWLPECHRLLKPRGNLLVMSTFHFNDKVVTDIIASGFERKSFKNSIIWHKNNPCPNFQCRTLTHSYEIINWFTKDKNYFFDYDWIKSITGKQQHDVLKMPLCPRSEKVYGEDGKPLCQQQKPLKLLKFLVRAFCPPNGSVLDPFAGTATTLVACQETNRSSVGIEVDPKTYYFAQQRLYGDNK
jgi:site-specific DNA-methyltransferase (adenine-specific)